MIKRKSWLEFRDSKLLWFVNRTLHIFGWAIVIATDEQTGRFLEAYPARVDFRGFGDETEEYKKLTEYLHEISHELKYEVNK